MTNKTLLWTMVLALAVGLAMGCGGMEEDEWVTTEEIEDVEGTVGSVEQAATVPYYTAVTTSCPTGYYRINARCPPPPDPICYTIFGKTTCYYPPAPPCVCDEDTTDFPCYKCCPKYTKGLCLPSPGCDKCHFYGCWCDNNGTRTYSSCVVVYVSGSWLWRCCYADGTCTLRAF